MVGGRYLEFANKSAPEEKTRRPKNSTVSDRDQNSQSITVEFFLIAVFFRGALLLPPPYSFYGGVTGSSTIDIP